MIVTLQPKPEQRAIIVAMMAAGKHDKIIARATSWLTNHGYAIGPTGVAATSDGSLIVDVDRDPTDEWSVIDPSRRLRAVQAQAAAEAGTLTLPQVNKVLAVLIDDYLDRVYS